MKYRLCIALIAMVILSGSQAVQAAGSSVTINPVGFAFGAFNGQYEQALDDRNSLVAGASFFGLNSGYWKISALGVNGGQRTYLNGTAPEGFFLEGKGGLQFVKATYDDGWDSGTSQGTMFSGVASAGYKWIGEGGFTTEVAAGAMASFGSILVGSETAPIAGFSPVLAANLGYSW